MRGPKSMLSSFAVSLKRHLIIAPPAVVALLMVCLLFQDRFPCDQLMRDTFAVVQAPPWIGLLSNLGVAAWLSAASCALFASGLMFASGRRTEPMRFLMAAGLLTAFLAVDDFLLIHEWFAPRYLRLDEHVIIALEGVVALEIGWRFRHLPLVSGD